MSAEPAAQPKESRFPADHPRGPNGGPLFLGEELCPICECCSLGSESCEQCGGEGVYGHDCGEDVCCCAYPEDNEPCDTCDGEGGFLACLGGCNFFTKESHTKRAEKSEAGHED